MVSTATGMDLTLAFLLGAMISATDPVAVVAMFKRLGAPARLATAIEAESLLNDGTGVVLFAIAVRALSSGVSAIDGVIAFAGAVFVSADHRAGRRHGRLPRRCCARTTT